MEGLGAVTGFGHDNGHFAFSFVFDAVEKAQKDYFKPKLEELKRQVEKLALFDVVRSAPSLDFILDNEYGDLVTLNDGVVESDISVDDFIRRLKSGVTYYVYEKVIFRH